MVHLKLVYRILGQLLFLEATFMFCCLAMAFVYREDDVFAFLVSALATVFGGFVLKIMGRDGTMAMSRRDAYLVVTSSWVVFSFFGTLPFLISGYLTSFTDAYFEAMSGFTTTGATVFDDVEALPHGLLFWRSMMQWIGGLGIVFFTIAILPSFVGGTVKVFAAEATGPIRTKLHPRLSSGAKSIWLVYIILTTACMGGYCLSGMGGFDAVNHAMTTTATGGMSTRNEGVMFFHSRAVDYTCIVFTFLSGINFTLLYASVVGLRVRQLFRNTEFRCYAGIVGAATLLVMLQLVASTHYGLERAFRDALFQVVSTITTTGMCNDNIALWPSTVWVVIALCMLIGGCSGSTSGGIKCIRIVMVMKTIRNEFLQILHPNAVLPMKIDGNNITNRKRVTLLAFLSTALIICLVMMGGLLAMGIDAKSALGITLGSLNNVGPSLEQGIGLVKSWGDLPDLAKWTCCLVMLVGRLEIFSVLVIFTPAYWKEN